MVPLVRSVASLRAVVALRRALAPGDLLRALGIPIDRERAFYGACTQPVFRRFLKVPRTTSAGKPDANFLLEIKHGLNDAQQKFHAGMARFKSTI